MLNTYGLNQNYIFSLRDPSFPPAVLSKTSGQGVDVVLNSLVGDLLHKSFEACANFGRFVEIGKRDSVDHGSLDMGMFGRNVSFMAFDLSNLYLSNKPSHHKLWHKLLVESMALNRTGIVKSCSPLETFKASDIIQTFRHSRSAHAWGKLQCPLKTVRVGSR